MSRHDLVNTFIGGLLQEEEIELRTPEWRKKPALELVDMAQRIFEIKKRKIEKKGKNKIVNVHHVPVPEKAELLRESIEVQVSTVQVSEATPTYQPSGVGYVGYTHIPTFRGRLCFKLWKP